MTKKIFVVVVFLFALIERVWFDLGPNIELITVATLLSAFYLDKKMTFFLTLFVVVSSDMIIGNTNILIFTWSGFLLPLLAINVFKNLKINKILSGTLAGISFNLFFFFWTNFGVWALDSWGMYPTTALGIIESYLNGLPFLKYQLISTLFFVPIGFLIYEILFNKLISKVKKPSAQIAFYPTSG